MIKDAKDTLLTEQSGTVPDMSSAILGYFQALSFLQISKAVDNTSFEVVETQTQIDTLGVWQPSTAEAIQQRPEGQRSWSWWTLHVLPEVDLKVDDLVSFKGKNFRVKDKSDYSLYGYREYHLIEDYQT